MRYHNIKVPKRYTKTLQKPMSQRSSNSAVVAASTDHA